MPALISRKPQRALAVTALVVAALIGVAIWMAQSGQTASAPDVSTVTATRGDVVVTVGGVGRIVTGSGVCRSSCPPRAAARPRVRTGSTSTSSTSVPADAVFARSDGARRSDCS